MKIQILNSFNFREKKSHNMVAIAILLCFVAFFTTDTDGKRFRNACGKSSSIRCDNGNCIHKHDWCDHRRDCSDNSDEKYCQSRPSDNSCNNDIHFKCDSGMCIPAEGYCDGYSNCPDQSDEKDCPCEDVKERGGNIQYEAYISEYRTQQKCWKISVRETQFLRLQISATLKNRNCQLGNVTIYSDVSSKDKNTSRNSFIIRNISSNEEFDNGAKVLCPNEISEIYHNNSFIYYKDVYIRYRSNFYGSSSSSYKDFLNLTFHQIDKMCKHPNAFKCSEYSCISPEKKCDGNKDCENGKDEINCDDHTLTAAYLRSSKAKAVKWVRSQHNADWSWKENTQRAVIALSLAGDANFNTSSKNDDLVAKQLELELFVFLHRHSYENLSSTMFALYINALQAICHDPHNFYGYDFTAVLKEEIGSSYAPPFLYLTLCNTREPLSEVEISKLLEILETGSQNHGIFLELQALVTLTLTCLKNNGIENLEQNITEALNEMKSMQMEDGSFGSDYTTALVLQALIANNQENSKDWNYNSSIHYLFKRQKADGSFGDFLTTYLVMPVLNGKSLIDIGKINCTGNKRPRNGNVLWDIQNRLGKKIIMKYSLFIGDDIDQIHPLVLRTPENITVLELMTLAADIDPKYKFKIHEIKKKKFIYEISNIPNDPENNRFWFIYHGSKNYPIPFVDQSPEKIKAHEKDHIIMWYKSLDLL